MVSQKQADAGSWLKRAAAFVLLPLTLALGGCYDLDTKFELRADGRVEVVSEIQFDREAQRVFEAIEAYATLDPRAGMFLSRGVCRGLELAGAMNPAMPMQLRATEGLQQVGDQERYVCRFTADLGTADEFADRIARGTASLPGDVPADVISFIKVSDRTYRLSVNAEAIPNTQPQAAADTLSSMLGAQTGRFPDRGEVEAFLQKVNGASIAITQMLYRGRTVTMTVKAPQIVDATRPHTDGEMRLQATATEFTAMMLEPAARQGASFSATLAY